jgi:Na+/melibiose symporter-like transporter
MLKHPLFRTLFNLRGNQKSAVLTEPLWGIPFNLYGPYVSVYMLSLGLKDSQIGLTLSISLAMQLLSALMSGPITDKLGRRFTTMLFDFISWSVPAMIWAVAQDFRYFVVAALFNGVWRVTHTSWTCLLVEDADQNELMDIYSWIYISGLLVGFFAPIAGLLINHFSLVPTMRGLYIFASVMFTIKFIILYFFSTETKQGKVRMEETRHQNLFSLVGGYGDVIKQVLRSPRTLFTLGIMLAFSSATMVNSTFWGILVTQKLHIPNANLALYSTVRSLTMLVFFFVVMPRIRELQFRNPMLVGFFLLAIGQLIVISVPEQAAVLLFASTFLEACSYATVSTQIDRMIAVTVEAKERARIMALLFVGVIGFTTPFGWIAGELSEINRTLPFLMNICLYAIGAVFTILAARQAKADAVPVESQVEVVVS